MLLFAFCFHFSLLLIFFVLLLQKKELVRQIFPLTFKRIQQVLLAHDQRGYPIMQFVNGILFRSGIFEHVFISLLVEGIPFILLLNLINYLSCLLLFLLDLLLSLLDLDFQLLLLLVLLLHLFFHFIGTLTFQPDCVFDLLLDHRLYLAFPDHPLGALGFKLHVVFFLGFRVFLELL